MLPLDGGTGFLVLAAPTRWAADWEQGGAFLHALLAQDRIGVSIRDANLTAVRSNMTPGLFDGLAFPPGSRLTDVLSAPDAEAVQAVLRGLLKTGVPLVGHEQRLRSPQMPGRQWCSALTGVRLSGDWFDVIPLPSLRSAFVVGDVIAHGLAATATMGRLRTAVQTLADLDLAPDEVLTHLDDLVIRLAAEADPAQQDTVGSTRPYAVYDPVDGRCTLASAGHPPPFWSVRTASAACSTSCPDLLWASAACPLRPSPSTWPRTVCWPFTPTACSTVTAWTLMSACSG